MSEVNCFMNYQKTTPCPSFWFDEGQGCNHWPFPLISRPSLHSFRTAESDASSPGAGY